MTYEFQTRGNHPRDIGGDEMMEIIEEFHNYLYNRGFRELETNVGRSNWIQGTLFETETVRVELSMNEFSILGKPGVEDPAGVRVGTSKGHTIGKFSYNHVRPDGRQEEMAFHLVNRWERMRWLEDRNLSGEYSLLLRDDTIQTGDDDDKFRRVHMIEPDGTFHIYGRVIIHNPDGSIRAVF